MSVDSKNITVVEQGLNSVDAFQFIRNTIIAT